MMRALVVLPDPTELPGLVGEALEERGVELVRFVVQPDASAPEGRTDFPDPAPFDLVVVLGSPWSVYDPAVAGWVVPLVELLRTAHLNGTPVLGICFGAQALAIALGGSVGPAPRSEIGFVAVESGVPALAGEWFEWHHDAIDPPPAASPIAVTEVGCQAFAVGTSLGVQFHPEVDAGLLARWTMDDTGNEFAAAGVDLATVLADAERRSLTERAQVAGLVTWFLESFAGR